MCFSSSKPDMPEIPEPVKPAPIKIPPPVPPAIPSKDVTENASRARQAQQDKVKRYRGQKSTLMTGGLGLDESASTSKKKLLSGTS